MRSSVWSIPGSVDYDLPCNLGVRTNMGVLHESVSYRQKPSSHLPSTTKGLPWKLRGRLQMHISWLRHRQPALWPSVFTWTFPFGGSYELDIDKLRATANHMRRS